MRIVEVKKGNKYFHTVTGWQTNKRTMKKNPETKTIYVVDIDLLNNRVCASINGLPAQWYDGNFYRRWTKNDPRKEDLKITNKPNAKKNKTNTNQERTNSFIAKKPGREHDVRGSV